MPIVKNDTTNRITFSAGDIVKSDATNRITFDGYTIAKSDADNEIAFGTTPLVTVSGSSEVFFDKDSDISAIRGGDLSSLAGIGAGVGAQGAIAAANLTITIANNLAVAALVTADISFRAANTLANIINTTTSRLGALVNVLSKLGTAFTALGFIFQPAEAIDQSIFTPVQLSGPLDVRHSKLSVVYRWQGDTRTFTGSVLVVPADVEQSRSAVLVGGPYPLERRYELDIIGEGNAVIVTLDSNNPGDSFVQDPQVVSVTIS